MNIELLIKNADKIKEKQPEKLFSLQVKRLNELGLDGSFRVRKPDVLLVSSYVERDRDSAYLVSESIVEPDLNNKELQSAYKVKNKKDLIKKILTVEEIGEMDAQLGLLMRKNPEVSLVDDLKN